ncbi:Peroxyureidoacrylate/ureidoacrylate amidohydrolase RutB [Talaromyces pinophilus]|nr:Peroxyureidoacrylate/ureidoacrylate amidohydrolase RutB [Talaromyces pinophilus]
MGEGSLLEVPVARAVVENVSRVSQALCSAGGTIAYAQYKYDPEESATIEAFTVGAQQHTLCPDLNIQLEDLIMPKTRWNVSIPGTCDLDSLLKAKGIDMLIIAGTATNCCCESTMRDAMQMGYHVLFVQDGNATSGDAAHNASLANMVLFGDVLSADEAISRIETA